MVAEVARSGLFARGPLAADIDQAPLIGRAVGAGRARLVEEAEVTAVAEGVALDVREASTSGEVIRVGNGARLEREWRRDEVARVLAIAVLGRRGGASRVEDGRRCDCRGGDAPAAASGSLFRGLAGGMLPAERHLQGRGARTVEGHGPESPPSGRTYKCGLGRAGRAAGRGIVGHGGRHGAGHDSAHEDVGVDGRLLEAGAVGHAGGNARCLAGTGASHASGAVVVVAGIPSHEGRGNCRMHPGGASQANSEGEESEGLHDGDLDLGNE